MVDAIAAALTRRHFVGRAATALAAVAASVFGFSKPAAACYVDAACCTLCQNPGPCSGDCCWSWTCCDTGSGDKFRCKECFDVTPCCCGDCFGTHNLCSSA